MYIMLAHSKSYKIAQRLYNKSKNLTILPTYVHTYTNDSSLSYAHRGQTDFNKILNTVKGTQQTSKWTPLGPKIS